MHLFGLRGGTCKHLAAVPPPAHPTTQAQLYAVYPSQLHGTDSLPHSRGVGTAPALLAIINGSACLARSSPLQALPYNMADAVQYPSASEMEHRWAGLGAGVAAVGAGCSLPPPASRHCPRTHSVRTQPTIHHPFVVREPDTCTARCCALPLLQVCELPGAPVELP